MFVKFDVNEIIMMQNYVSNYMQSNTVMMIINFDRIPIFISSVSSFFPNKLLWPLAEF